MRSKTAPRSILEFTRFCIVGLSGVFVNIGGYLLLTRLMQVPLELASPLAIEVSIICNFICNDRWTFAQRQLCDGWMRRMWLFHGVCALGGMINYLVLVLLVNRYGWWDVYANFAGIVLGVAAKFFASSAWTWREITTKL